MEYIYDIDVKSFYKALTSLRNRIWKLLPIYEGKDKQGGVIIPPETAYRNFKKNLQKLTVEVNGANDIFFSSSYFVQLLCLLQGLDSVTIDEHEKVKNIVTHCADLCEKIKEGG